MTGRKLWEWLSCRQRLLKKAAIDLAAMTAEAWTAPDNITEDPEMSPYKTALTVLVARSSLIAVIAPLELPTTIDTSVGHSHD